MKKLIRTLAVITALSALLFSGACNTFKGAGQDIESAGKKIQKTFTR